MTRNTALSLHALDVAWGTYHNAWRYHHRCEQADAVQKTALSHLNRITALAKLNEASLALEALRLEFV